MNRRMKVYVWGTGRLAGSVVGNLIKLNNIEGFIDNDASKREYMGKPVYSPQSLPSLEYDAILVANLYAVQIKKQCDELGISDRRLFFLYNNCQLLDLNNNYEYMSSILDADVIKRTREQHHIIREPVVHGKLCFDSKEMHSLGGYIKDDFVRIKSMELCVKEIYKRGLKGDVAEVGVFRGEFSQYINYAFPDKRCYLFDTFEGFHPDESRLELKNGNCTPAFIEAYKNTSLREVINRLLYPQNVYIKQGLFPDSVGDLDEQFCFVSIDVDFEDSIYTGLKYFYPRLEDGGYIFVHDYNSDLQGVEKAVDRFEKELGKSISKVPLCDKSGTLVITK